MKKLYYLDESEKERILHLHENKTKNQYLLTEQREEPARTPFNDNLRNLCKNKTYGNPTLSDGELTQKFEYYWANFSKRNRSSWFTGSALSRIKDVIRQLKTINNFCAINQKYIDAGGYSNIYPSGDLIYGMSKFVYSNEAWETNIKTPLQELINASTKPKNDTGSDTEISAMIETGKKTITTYCSTAQGGTVNEAAYEVFKFATQGRGYMSDSTWKNVLSKIKSLSINDFCAIYKKYEQEIGKNLIDKFLSYLLSPTAKQEIITLITSMTKGSSKTNTSGTSGTGSTSGVIAGGMGVIVTQIPPDVLKQLRTLGGSTETANTITQNDINALYTFLYNKLPKK